MGTAREDWDAYCTRESWYGGEGMRLAQAVMDEQAAVIAALRRELELGAPQVPGEPARVDIYPRGWGTDRIVEAHLGEKLTEAAEAARGSGRVTILTDGEGGLEVAALVNLAWLRRGDGPQGIPDRDLKVDLFRAPHSNMSLAVGVETTVRITHIPTGLSAECDTGRSQLQNKALAMAESPLLAPADRATARKALWDLAREVNQASQDVELQAATYGSLHRALAAVEARVGALRLALGTAEAGQPVSGPLRAMTAVTPDPADRDTWPLDSAGVPVAPPWEGLGEVPQ